VQLTTPQGPIYVVPERVVLIGPHEQTAQGREIRTIVLEGGVKWTIDDTPDNLEKIL